MTVPLQTTGVGRRYGDRWALRDCSLQLAEGSITALVGPNGAGKSTLIELAVGLITPTVGTVSVYGLSPGGSPESLARIAYLAQDHPLYRGFTVADMLHYGRAMNPRWDGRLAREHLTNLGIPERSRIGQLSGGQQAQVALTLGLAKRADLIVLDEPVASLDPLARRAFMSTLLAHAAEYGTTVLLSSHVVSELERVADHLILLAEGRLQVDGEIDGLLNRHRVLTGPRMPDRAAPPGGVRRVLVRTDTDRQTALTVELDGPVLDPRWEEQPMTLEDLVLTYLGNPDSGGRPPRRPVALPASSGSPT